jgi:hypothetical protein
MLSVQRRAALALRLQEDTDFTKQAAMEKVAAYKEHYGWMWPLAAQDDPEVGDMEKQAIFGMAARFLAGAGRAAGGAVQRGAGKLMTRFSRAGGKASRMGQRGIQRGSQTAARGKAQMSQAARAREVGLSQKMTDVIGKRTGGPGYSASATKRQAAKSGNQAAKPIVRETLKRRAAASYKPTIGEKIKSRVGSGKGGAGERRWAKEVGGQHARKEVGRARTGTARSIYGEYAPQELKRSGLAKRQQGLLEGAVNAPAAARGVGDRLKGAWNVLSGKGRTVKLPA